MVSQALFLLLGLIGSVAKHGLGAATGTRSPWFSPPASGPEKAGQCPAGRVQAVPPSRVFCLSDASCPGSEKCCNLGLMRICVQPAMVGPGYCPKLCSATEEPCLVSCLDDSWCGPGEKCCQDDCHVHCVLAEPVRPGSCPRTRVLSASTPCPDQCDDDRSCPEGQKCCFTGCSLQCVSPWAEDPPACTEAVSRAAVPKTCPDLCLADTDCSGDRKCSPTDCGFQCTELLPAERPGVCPEASQGPLEFCQDWCSTDSECPGAKKCCSRNGCGRICAEPRRVKPGVCPLLLRGSLGPCPGSMRKNCSDDLDCPAAEKCCSTGCSYACTEPEEVRPGACPPSAAEKRPLECSAAAAAATPTTFCVKDADCPQPEERCCRRHCGWVCLAPAS
ncbi:WAP four-disulfide core domain protein 3-like [Hemicordylus capensis]|uniref:WAP four-disulfide core domain protein 3-like n=1 Tax=Hemicordylus capensis TaxID=884348 RepID=UPI002302CCF1|nr:WAP four-disulfide core domain protein 3-like [Hemicordylus capensis]